MKQNELTQCPVLLEIDDVQHARFMVQETMHLCPELRMIRIAEMLTNLREYYVQIGRNIECAEQLDH